MELNEYEVDARRPNDEEDHPHEDRVRNVLLLDLFEAIHLQPEEEDLLGVSVKDFQQFLTDHRVATHEL